MDDSGFSRTPDRPVKLLGTRVHYQWSVETTIDARGPDFSGGSARFIYRDGSISFLDYIPMNPWCLGSVDRINKTDSHSSQVTQMNWAHLKFQSSKLGEA